MIELMLILLPYKSEVKHQHDIFHDQDDGEKNYFEVLSFQNVHGAVCTARSYNVVYRT